MEKKPCLNDKDEFPDDKVLSRCLGKVKPVWDSYLAMIAENHPSFSAEWRYYRDGNNWLYKVTKKKKTICWVSVWIGAFKATFYFPDRAEDAIATSRLRKEYIEQFLHGRRYGKIRGVTVVVKRSSDLSSIRKLIAIKEQLK
ncbi:MAG: DUF3788 family protein [Phycisphaerales bacterium]|nr:MAG: DUF3788 family protein [Phycisphaerales bacterium]